MKSWNPFFCLILLFLIIPSLSGQKFLDGVVKIETKNIFDETGETGTGIIVGDLGNYIYIVTAYHVVQDAKIIQVKFHNEGGKFYPVVLDDVQSNPELDIALLRLQRNFRVNPAFRMVDRYILKNGFPVTMVGHPGGGKSWEVNKRNQVLDLRFKPAKISSTNFGIAGGFSGGPILSKNKSRLIGIINERNNVQVIGTDIEDIYVQLKDWDVFPNLLMAPRRTLNTLTYPLAGVSIGSLIVAVTNVNYLDDKYKIYQENKDARAPIYEEIGIPREDLLNRLKTRKTVLTIGGYTLAGISAAAALWLNLKRRRLPGGQVGMEIVPIFPYSEEMVVGLGLGMKIQF